MVCGWEIKRGEDAAKEPVGGGVVNRGVEGFVLQFSDFGTPETIEHFMTGVVPLVKSGMA